jgi:hypothetical protein
VWFRRERKRASKVCCQNYQIFHISSGPASGPWLPAHAWEHTATARRWLIVRRAPEGAAAGAMKGRESLPHGMGCAGQTWGAMWSVAAEARGARRAAAHRKGGQRAACCGPRHAPAHDRVRPQLTQQSTRFTPSGYFMCVYGAAGNVLLVAGNLRSLVCCAP